MTTNSSSSMRRIGCGVRLFPEEQRQPALHDVPQSTRRSARRGSGTPTITRFAGNVTLPPSTRRRHRGNIRARPIASTAICQNGGLRTWCMWSRPTITFSGENRQAICQPTGRNATRQTLTPIAVRWSCIIRKPFAPTADNELLVAVAQVKQGSNLTQGIVQLTAAIEKYKPQRAEYIWNSERRSRRTGESKRL